MNKLKLKYIKEINKSIKKNTKLLSKFSKSWTWGHKTDTKGVISSGNYYSNFRDMGISVTEMREKPIVDEIIKQTNRLIQLFIDNPSNLEFSKDGNSYYLKNDGIICSFTEGSIFVSYKQQSNGHVIYEVYFDDSDLDKDVDKNLIEEFIDLYKKLRYKYSEDVIELIKQKMH